MTSSQPRSGYTLPVFACAAAKAALQHLQQFSRDYGESSPQSTPNIGGHGGKGAKGATLPISTEDYQSSPQSTPNVGGHGGKGVRGATLPISTEDCQSSPQSTPNVGGHGGKEIRGAKLPINTVEIDLIEPQQTVKIPIEQVAILQPNTALAITRSDPGDNLDLTRNTPIWAMVELRENSAKTLSQTEEKITLIGGEGIGYNQSSGNAAIYRYANRLFQHNLEKILTPSHIIQVTIILPEGRQLAKRTSNEAFGVVEGLSLLGTTGISQPLSAPGQLEAYCAELQQKATQYKSLVFCVGENGLDLAQKLGVRPQQTVKTANWLGPMLAAAGLAGIESIVLFGYHGKLIKLAGGIFHTHHHLADGRLEILTAHCANLGLQRADIAAIFQSSTAEDALSYLRTLDASQSSQGSNRSWVSQVYEAIANAIDQKSQAYIRNHAQAEVMVGSILFDRQRQIITKSTVGDTLLAKICYPTQNK